MFIQKRSIHKRIQGRKQTGLSPQNSDKPIDGQVESSEKKNKKVEYIKEQIALITKRIEKVNKKKQKIEEKYALAMRKLTEVERMDVEVFIPKLLSVQNRSKSIKQKRETLFTVLLWTNLEIECFEPPQFQTQRSQIVYRLEEAPQRQLGSWGQSKI